MLKEKALAGMPTTVGGTEEQAEGNVRIFTTLAFMALGLVLPQARIYDVMAPFGVSLAASIDGTGGILIYIATMIGYMLKGEGFPLRYMVAVALAGAVRWVFGVLPTVARHKAFSPLLGFGAVVASGLLVPSGDGLLPILLMVAEGMLAGGFAYFFGEIYMYLHRARGCTVLSLSEQTGVILLGAVALMGLAPIEFSMISPGRILAGVLVMLFARSGREQSGAVAGAILATAFALSSPERPYVALALGLGGLLSGVFSKYGRFAIAGVYLIAHLLLSLSAQADMLVAVSIYEAVAACVVFVILPRRVDKLLRRFLVFGQHLPAVEGLRRSMSMRLDVAATAMQEVADTVEQVSKKLTRYGAPDLGSMYRYVGDTVCRDCGLKMYCWETTFSETMDAFNQLTPVLREKCTVTKEDLRGSLARTCRRQGEVAAQVGRGYQLYLQRESAWQRLSEIRSVISEQFSGMGDVLSELGARFAGDRRVDVEIAGRVVSLCEDFGMPVEEAVCSLDHRGRMTVEILAQDVAVCLDGGRWFREMETCCGREFDKPDVLEMQGMVKITMIERPRFKAEFGLAQQTCVGEKLSGDVCERYTDGGKFTCILSDGMGSGGRAAVDGTMAAGITARLLRAGLAPDTVLKLVNTALLAKSGDESLTTLDVLEVDLFTGGVCVYKAGAAPSVLKCDGRISRIDMPSLPVGILQEVGFAVYKDALRDEDVVLLMSDGMLFDGLSWIEEFLRDSQGTAEQLANGLLEEAVSRCQDKTQADDMTVAVVLMHKK